MPALTSSSPPGVSVAKPPHKPRPTVQRGLAVFFENSDYDEQYEAEVGLTFTYPARFPLEFTNAKPPEVTVSKDPKPPIVTPRDVIHDFYGQSDSPKSSDHAPLTRYPTSNTHEPKVQRRADGSTVTDSHHLVDPSDGYY